MAKTTKLQSKCVLTIISSRDQNIPNWCYNTLRVEGSEQDIRRFIIENAGDGENMLSFARHLPYPNSNLSEVEQYWWRILRWGTKWDVGGGMVED